MNVLLIGHADNRAENFIKPLKELRVNPVIWRADKSSKPAINHDAIIITGGPMNTIELTTSKQGFFPEEIAFIKSELAQKTPILGVCLGHQLLAHLLGGKVSLGKSWQIGWKKQTLTPGGRINQLFEDLPITLVNFEFHQDHVIKKPRGSTVLANSDNCAIESFALKNKPVWGIQFHPEISDEKSAEIFKSEKSRIASLGIDIKQEIKKGQISYSPSILKKILKNFLGAVN